MNSDLLNKMVMDDLNVFKRKNSNFYHASISGVYCIVHKRLFSKLKKYKNNKLYCFNLINNNRHMIFIK